MRILSKGLALGLLFLSACAPVKPELGTLQQMGGFSVTTNQSIMQSSSWLVPFQGKCTSSYSDVEWSYDNGATWYSVKINAPASVIDCAGTGTFSGSLDISSISSLLSSLQKNTSVSILLRGQTLYGPSAAYSILLLPSKGKYTDRMVAGSHISTTGTNAPGFSATGVILYGHVGGNIKSIITSGYSLQGQLHSQY